MRFIFTSLKFYLISVLFLFGVALTGSGELNNLMLHIGVVLVKTHPINLLALYFKMQENFAMMDNCLVAAILTLPIWLAFLWESGRKIQERQTFIHKAFNKS